MCVHSRSTIGLSVGQLLSGLKKHPTCRTAVLGVGIWNCINIYFLHMIHVHHVHICLKDIYIYIHSSKNLIRETIEVACRSHSWMASASTHGQSWLWGILDLELRCRMTFPAFGSRFGIWYTQTNVLYTAVINGIHGTGTNCQQSMIDMIDMIVCYQAHVFYNHKKTSTGST